MELCDKDERCSSLECGEDMHLPDNSVKYAHCSWWSNNTCRRPEEFTLNPANYILTCKKTDIGKIGYAICWDKLKDSNFDNKRKYSK